MTASKVTRPLLHTVAPRRSLNLQQTRALSAWVLVAPVLILLFSVAAWPLLQTFYISFTDASLGSQASANFIGLANYLDTQGDFAFGVLADPLWWRAVSNTLLFSVTTVSLELVLGMLVALLLHQKFHGRTLVRTAILIPWAIPTIVSAKLWGWMFHDQYGVINDLLIKVGLISEPLAWVAVPELSMVAVIIAEVWKTTPFMALMLLAALQMIPEDLYESARLEGASAWQRYWRITLPLIKPALIVALIFRTLDALRVFDLIYVLTSNSESTISISGYSRQLMVEYQDMGGGSAASVLVFMLVAGIAVTYLYFGRVNLSNTGDHE